MNKIDNLLSLRKIIVVLVFIIILSFLSAYPFGSLYQYLIPATAGGWGLNSASFQGFFLSIPFWLSILSIIFFTTIRSYLLFTLPVIVLYLFLISQGSWQVFLKWMLPLIVIPFGFGTLIGCLIKMIRLKAIQGGIKE